MKREFLRNLKVAEQPLPEDVIDLIMAEAGRDLEAAKKPFADYDTIKQQLSEAQTTLQGIQNQSTDLATAQQKAQEWENKYNQAIADHKAEMDNLAFDQVLKDAIAGAKGRNAKAIIANLDVEALRESKNQADDIKAALEGLKKDNGYLFEAEQSPPPYAANTGVSGFGTPGSGEFNFGFTGVRPKETGK